MAKGVYDRTKAKPNLGWFKKGICPSTVFKKGMIPWNIGIKQWDIYPHPKGMLGKVSPKRNPIKVICLSCSKEFYSVLSRVKKGKKFCSKKCQYKFYIGKNNPRYGKHHTKETKEKIKISNTGKKVSEETRRKIGLANKKRIGEKAANWKGGITSINKKIRNSNEYKLWRKAIFIRDNYTCVWCSIKGGKLHADHIKSFALYPELRFEVSNGRTLCIPCHRKTDTWGRQKMKSFFGG